MPKRRFIYCGAWRFLLQLWNDEDEQGCGAFVAYTSGGQECLWMVPDTIPEEG